MLFCTSLSWRVLRFFIEVGLVFKYTPDAIAQITRAELVWREVPSRQAPAPRRHQQHLLPIDRVDKLVGEFSPNINRYLMRSIDLDLRQGRECLHIREAWPFHRLNIRSGIPVITWKSSALLDSSQQARDQKTFSSCRIQRGTTIRRFGCTCSTPAQKGAVLCIYLMRASSSRFVIGSQFCPIFSGGIAN
ncbi:hypothetical protein AWB67_02269 [Caballeronia terrestris]|uniref:Uncharacterized protein n=1 Tax=Caballeronia terrestris TaxID=1226301 RepID=A0A158HZX5_9BURK|nr:hypothetical protein AWB67_02269 [Caballeronia terrestris]